MTPEVFSSTQARKKTRKAGPIVRRRLLQHRRISHSRIFPRLAEKNIPPDDWENVGDPFRKKGIRKSNLVYYSLAMIIEREEDESYESR